MNGPIVKQCRRHPRRPQGVTMPLPPVMGSLGSPVPASLIDSMDAVINHQGSILILLLKFIYSEKATKFCEIFT